MTATDLVPSSPGDALEANPVEYMAVVLNRAKSWLAEAASIDEVRNTKAIMVGYESVIREKELAFDAQLSATEIVRRCERRIGELVRKGQEDGSFATQGQRVDQLRRRGDEVVSPVGTVFVGNQERADVYSMSNASEEDFDKAIADAREEGNLSRANVVRKVKSDREILADRTAALRGEATAQPPEITERERVRNQAHARRFTDFVSTLSGYAEGIDGIDRARIRAAMEPKDLEEWTKSLGAALRKIHRLKSDLQGGRD